VVRDEFDSKNSKLSRSEKLNKLKSLKGIFVFFFVLVEKGLVLDEELNKVNSNIINMGGKQ
jgi:hypothetical protein